MQNPSQQPQEVAAPQILVCDDDPLYHRAMGVGLRGAFSLVKAFSGRELLELLPQHAGCVVLLDLNLADGESGMDVLRQVRRADPRTRIIVHSGLEDYESIVAAMQLGAVDYVPKACGMPVLRRALRMWTTQEALTRQGNDVRAHFTEHSEAAKACMQQVRQFAAPRGHVLIVGELGSGKGLVAKTLAESTSPFVTVTAAALAAPGGEEKLFGTRSSGKEKSQGLLQAAQGGTLLIDEVGDLPLPLQVRLMRAVEMGLGAAAGDTAAQATDVKLVCTSQYNLQERSRAGLFRADFLARIAVLVVNVPPLRQRREDIAPLAQAFVAQLPGGESIQLSAQMLTYLEGQMWPGNVRQLVNAMQYMLAVAGDRPPQVSDLTPLLGPGVSAGEDEAAADSLDLVAAVASTASYRERLRAQETKLLKEEFSRANFNVATMASRVDMSRTYLYDKLRSLGILRGKSKR